MAQAFYRKYRPKLFEDVLGQGRVTVTLQQALKTGHVSHAYVFSGPRGTGKTTVARLLARSLNCQQLKDNKLSTGEPCNECPACLRALSGTELDLIEIDAASNRGIDEVRQLREAVRFAPSRGRKKVLLVDEFHMLTKEAFNALLKTLEEPPEHAVFILATTEAHSIPATVLSRAQHFAFSALTTTDLTTALKKVAKAEGLAAEPTALEMIAVHAEGGARDALSALDLLASAAAGRKLTPEIVRETLALPDYAHIETWVAAIGAGDTRAALLSLRQALVLGSEPYALSRALVRYVRLIMLVQIDVALLDETGAHLTSEQRERVGAFAGQLSPTQVLRAATLLSQAANQVRLSPSPLLPLEIATLSLEDKHRPAPDKPSAPKQPGSGRTETVGSVKKNIRVMASDNISADSAELNQSTVDSLLNQWGQAVDKIRVENVSLAGLLRTSILLRRPGRRVTVVVKHAFYRERLMERRNRHLVEQQLEQLVGKKVLIECKLTAELTDEERKLHDAELAKGAIQAEEKSPTESTPLAQLAVDLLGGQLIE